MIGCLEEVVGVPQIFGGLGEEGYTAGAVLRRDLFLD